MSDDRAGKHPHPSGEADTPREAHDEAAPAIRKLRHGDDLPQSDDPPANS